MKRIKVLGITGGVGAGKSTVLSYLEEQCHARVLQLDQAAHLLMQPGEECYRRIIEYFGEEILCEDGTIDRKKLGAVVFKDPQKLQVLNQIVHPAVEKYVDAEIKKEQELQRVPFMVLEAALLLDSHYESVCDSIWYIYASEEVRSRRLAASRGYTSEKTKNMMKNQMSEAQFREKCEFAVDNSSDIIENTYRQIDKGLRTYGFL
ncbi:MAG: dephospho-CoA kinase [Eubacteriales bacterium]|nr:dephospho-CoA kinase [Eubacteriales bacterium]